MTEIMIKLETDNIIEYIKLRSKSMMKKTINKTKTARKDGVFNPFSMDATSLL